ncbi:cellulase family glycosylhydrolase [Dactylosporangium roseum]|uniref:cellulase n=1 Tax=Dactylosporangium roseum TaxID=47989 RepID=A0ABY5Z049_9ACTN|nr:cellulase family glycosylhydrolase [Dactylosporangium roseum]UWZ35396.1 cellulase family glycosylhydrolase [Dactylosporangium roseum]
MRTVLVVAMLLAGLGVLAPRDAHAAEPRVGIHVRDGRVVEANGSDLVLRGVNHDFMWWPNRNDVFAGIKTAGANAVRVPLGIGHQWRLAKKEEVANLVGLCAKNRLICVMDAHDTTGFGQDKKAATMAQAVRFWLDMRDVLVGHEDHIIVNLANEPFGNGTTMPWVQQTSDAIRSLRAAGLKHALMIDGPGWGQDESFVMRDNAERVVAADPLGNTLFDIHMYGMFNNAGKVNSYLSSFTQRRLPIVIGEFSGEHQWGDPDEDAIMAYAEARELGYFGWSWSGNDAQYSYLDLVKNFDANSRTAWGQRFINGPNGLTTDTREATVFRNGTGADQKNRAPRGVTVADVTSNSVRLNWQRRPGAVGTTYQVVAVNGAAEVRVLTTSRTDVTLKGLKGSTEYTYAVYSRDLLGKRSPRSAMVAAVTPPAR